MSAFLEGFLRNGAPPRGWLRRLVSGAGQPAAPRTYLGAFGKHPGWDDHLDDIGLETETLALAKQLLYVEGIGGRLNAGAWDALPADKRLEEFWHVFLWRRDGQTLVGRLWSSLDRKGRARYPMVVCAELHDLPLAWILHQALPRLEAIEAACRATHDADEVRAILDNQRQALAQDAATASDAGQPAAPWPREWSDPGEPALRVLYRVRNQLANCAPGRGHGEGGARELRLSTTPDTAPGETLRSWAAALETLLDPAAPVLYFLPLEGIWLDIVVGEPVSESFFAPRAAPAALPPADQVPYSLDPVWSAQAGAFLARVRLGDGVNVHCAQEFWRLPAG